MVSIAHCIVSITHCIVSIAHCNCILATVTIAAPAIAPVTDDPVSDCAPNNDCNIAAVVPAKHPAAAVTATATVLIFASHSDCKMPIPAAAPAAAPTATAAIVDVTVLPTTTTIVTTVSAIVIFSGDCRVALCSPAAASPGSAIEENCLKICSLIYIRY